MKFYRRYWIYFVISAFLLVPGLISLGWQGLKPGIDFTGGSLLTIAKTGEAPTTNLIVSDGASLSPLPYTDSGEAALTETLVREAVGDYLPLSSVQQDSLGQMILRLPPITNDQKLELLASISAQVPVEQVSFASVGAVMGQELIIKTIFALLLASVFLVIYLRVRFSELSFGAAAFLMVLHDLTIISGIFSILGWWWGVEVDVLFVTALLTTISFSVHDTVVIYDRIRELKTKFPHSRLHELAEAAVTATISRSFNNSLTIVFMLAALLLLGGVTLRWFALALLLGVIFGTYSSPFCSIPLILFFDDWKKTRISKGKKKGKRS